MELVDFQATFFDRGHGPDTGSLGLMCSGCGLEYRFDFILTNASMTHRVQDRPLEVEPEPIADPEADASPLRRALLELEPKGNDIVITKRGKANDGTDQAE